MAEALVAGRERLYLRAFFDARIFDASAISGDDLDIYASAYEAPGAMRAGFEVYRAFDRDVEDNRDALKRNGKLTVPVLAVFAAVSNSGPLVEEMMREVAETVTALRVPQSAHWIAEENPSAFTEGLLKFLQSIKRVKTDEIAHDLVGSDRQRLSAHWFAPAKCANWHF